MVNQTGITDFTGGCEYNGGGRGDEGVVAIKVVLLKWWVR